MASRLDPFRDQGLFNDPEVTDEALAEMASVKPETVRRYRQALADAASAPSPPEDSPASDAAGASLSSAEGDPSSGADLAEGDAPGDAGKTDDAGGLEQAMDSADEEDEDEDVLDTSDVPEDIRALWGKPLGEYTPADKRLCALYFMEALEQKDEDIPTPVLAAVAYIAENGMPQRRLEERPFDPDEVPRSIIAVRRIRAKDPKGRTVRIGRRSIFNGELAAFYWREHPGAFRPYVAPPK